MRWSVKVALLLLIAVGLPFAIFENRVEPAHCSYDVCEPSPGWLAITRNDVFVANATGQIFDESKAPSNTPGRIGYVGIYPRRGVPSPLAYIFGFGVPFVLIWRAFQLLKRRLLTERAVTPT